MILKPNPSKTSTRLAGIDGLRAIAILMVYTYHVWQFAGEPRLPIGTSTSAFDPLHLIATFPAGVDLFMVLSGFCLALPLFRTREGANWNASEYAVRRARRIIPPYYGAILYSILLPQVLAVAARTAGVEAKWQVVPAWWDIAAHLLFIHTLFPQTWAGITGAFWSMGLEAQFYVTFPLVVLLYRRIGLPRTVACLIGISILYRAAAEFLLAGQDGTIRFLATITFVGRWMQFGLGMLAAWIVTRELAKGRVMKAALGDAIIAFAVGIYLLATLSPLSRISFLPVRDLLLGVSFAALAISVCLSGGLVGKLSSARPLVALGTISYSFFLIHQPTAWLLSELFRRWLHVDGLARFSLLMSLGLFVTLAISLVFFQLLERPFLQAARSRRPNTPRVPLASVESGAAL